MNKNTKIGLGVGVLVLGYFLYKKKKGVNSTSKPNKESGVLHGVATGGGFWGGGSRTTGVNKDIQILVDKNTNFKELGVKKGDAISPFGYEDMEVMKVSDFNSNVVWFRSTSSYPIFKVAGLEYVITIK